MRKLEIVANSLIEDDLRNAILKESNSLFALLQDKDAEARELIIRHGRNSEMKMEFIYPFRQVKSP